LKEHQSSYIGGRLNSDLRRELHHLRTGELEKCSIDRRQGILNQDLNARLTPLEQFSKNFYVNLLILLQ